MRTLLLDCETTGLIENRTVRASLLPEVIELYACIADTSSMEVKEEINELIKPKKLPLEPVITKITGITNRMLEDKLPFETYAESFREMVERADRVIAHNCSFDAEVLEIEFQRLGLTIKWPELVCTVEMSLHYKGYRLSLSALHEHLFGEKFEGAHRAKADVMALLRCASEMDRRGDL